MKGVVLFHGAGSDRDHSSLKLIEKTFKPIPVKRVNFPYRRAGKPFPDPTPVLLECIRKEVLAAAKKWNVDVSDIVIGGRSMGGRMCSMVVAGADCDALQTAGLVLISYPLHPPGKPEKLRAAHLSQIHVPTLFIHGTKDPFGSPEELKQHTRKIRGAKTIKLIEGARHELKGKDADIASCISEWVSSL